MDESPLVSIVIPAHNAEKTPAPLLDSLQAQTYPHLQIIITDDGSQDQTLAVARRYAEADRRFNSYFSACSGTSCSWRAGPGAFGSTNSCTGLWLYVFRFGLDL